MRGFIIGLMLAGLVVAGQEKKAAFTPLPIARVPISVSANEAMELKDLYTNAILADAQWQNRVLRAKVDHSVPADYVYNMQKSRFEVPESVPTPVPASKDKP